MRPRILVPAVSVMLALTTALPAAAASQPGTPCPTNDAYEQLGSGWILCVNGTWQPSSGPSGPTAGPTTPPASGSSSVTPVKPRWKTVGTALSAATFGSSKGQVADPSAIRLPNGKVRIFAFVAEEGVRSAVSTNASGTSFVADAAKPIPWTMAGQPRVVSLGGNSMRMFYLSSGNIQSAISADGGLTFTDEGPVITTAQAGFEPGGLTVIKHRGIYRGYFSNLEKPGVMAPRVIRTATSPDMLNWTMGPVITQSTGALAEGGSHPFAVIDKKGTIALYYSGDRASYYGILVSTSKNGVTFANERSVMDRGGDGDLISAGKSGALMYYGADVGGGEFGVKVAKTTGKLVP